MILSRGEEDDEFSTQDQAGRVVHAENPLPAQAGSGQLGQQAGQLGPPTEVKQCAGCGNKIHDKYLLQAMDMFWHEDCLKCGCCDCRLGEVGHSLYTKGNLILCKRDYLRLFGSTGYCAACSKVIPAFEMVMRARANVYHLECFACQQCGHRFCVGDQFYLLDNKILCQSDYTERMLFANNNRFNQMKAPPAGDSPAQALLPASPIPGRAGSGRNPTGYIQPGPHATLNSSIRRFQAVPASITEHGPSTSHLPSARAIGPQSAPPLPPISSVRSSPSSGLLAPPLAGSLAV